MNDLRADIADLKNVISEQSKLLRAKDAQINELLANREKDIGDAWDAAEEATKNACYVCDCVLGPHTEFESTTNDKATYIEQVKNKL
jgi:phage terminase large subunit-like protein